MISQLRLPSLFLSLLCCLFCTTYIFFVQDNDKSRWDLVLFMAFSIIQFSIIYFNSYDRRVVSPVAFFILSYLIFIAARGWLLLFVDEPMVQAGYYAELSDQLNALFVSLLMFSSICCFYIIMPSGLFHFYSRLKIDSLKTNKYGLVSIIFILAIFFLFTFFISSFKLISVVGDSNYLEIAGSEVLIAHFKWFFLGKWLLVLYLFLSRGNSKFLIASLALFLSSIGFLFIGLRGYTIAYFFLFLYFYSVRYKINIIFLLLLGGGLCFVAAVVIEYRLGYKLYDGFLDALSSTFHQQGATFEVLYGVFKYHDEVRSCVELLGYYSKQTDFGKCVDLARGINWEYGGFATSFFAEVYYFYLPLSILVMLLFSYALRFLDCTSFSYVQALDGKANMTLHGVMLFMLVPNLIYFSRSDAFDFIGKFFIFLIFCFLFSFVLGLFKGSSIISYKG